MGELLPGKLICKTLLVGTLLPAFFLWGSMVFAYGDVPNWQEWNSAREGLFAEQDSIALKEKMLLQNLLELQLSAAKLKKQLQELNQGIQVNMEQISRAGEEIELTQDKLKDDRKLLGEWLRYYYYSGSLTYLGVIFGSNDFAELLTRLQIVQKLVDYSTGLINRTTFLEGQLKQQKEQLAWQLRKLEESRRRLRQKEELLTKNLAEREKELDTARQLSKESYGKLVALEKQWAALFPQLDYILSIFPSLPWYNIEPDKLSLNLLQRSAVLEITEGNLNRQLTLVDRKLKDLQFELSSGAFALSQKNEQGQDFKIWGNLKAEGSKVVYLPIRLEVAGTALQEEAFKLLIEDYNLSFSLGREWQGLNIRGIEISEGKVKFTLNFNPNN